MNMQALMKQAQNLQNEMMTVKGEIDSMTFTGDSSLVKVIVNGKKKILKVEMNLDDFDNNDKEILEDMIVTAINNAFDQVDKVTEEKMGKFSKVPGLF